jgi:PEP-CTERM/exosortase A-associated glycosyltransferase
MRILHVLDHSLPLQSGYVSRTLGILTEQRARGWETVHLTTPRQNASAEGGVEEVGAWKFFRTRKPTGVLSKAPIGSYLAEMRESARRIGEVIKETSPDIIHAHSPVLNGLPAYWSAQASGLPLVYEVRALWEDAAVEAGTDRENSMRYRMSRALETYVLKRADAVTVLCEGVRSDVVGRGIPGEKVTIIPNSVDVDRFPLAGAKDQALVTRFGLGASPVLGFLGSYYDYEGLDILLDALPEILRQRPDIRVLLVGGGPMEASLRQRASDLGVQESVTFVGRVKFDDIDRYYDLIDLFVYPRRKRRLTDLVTPLKPLEAMAKGRIVLASDCGGHRELVKHGETGFLFKADDPAALATAVLTSVASQELWPTVSANGRAFVERERTWKASVGRYAPIYERLAARGRRG